MASITDCVAEGLKYPFNDIKRLLGFGALFAILDLASLAFSLKAIDITRTITHALENTTAHLTTLPASQMPSGDICVAVGIVIFGFIVSLFIMGYQYDVIRLSIERKDDLPGFSDILAMFIKGVKYFIVAFAYSLPSMIVMLFGMMALGDMSVMPVVIVISGLLLIIAFFLMIMALNNMVAHDSLKKAFDFGEITSNISNLGWGKYIGTVLFTLIVFAIISAAASFILSFLTVAFASIINNQAVIVSVFITIIEGLFVSSYCSVFYNRVCGSIYRESVK